MTKNLRIEVLRENIRRGKRRLPEICPIARALNRTLRGQGDISVYTDTVVIGSRRYKLSKTAQSFIKKFDDGKVAKNRIKPFVTILKPA